MSRYGLFAGINDYQNGITPLSYARGDASCIYQKFLAEDYSVDLLLDKEVTPDTVLSTLRRRRSEFRKGDIFVFYFSGHGCEIKGNHYLLSSTADAGLLDFQFGLIPISLICQLTNVPGLQRLFILDSCRSDLHENHKGVEHCPASRDLSLKNLIKENSGMDLISPPLILTSCGTGEKSFESEAEGKGIFTSALLNVIGNRQINSFEKFKRELKTTVDSKVAQLVAGQKQTVSWNGDVYQDIILFDRWANLEPAKPEPPKPEPVKPEVPKTEPVKSVVAEEKIQKTKPGVTEIKEYLQLSLRLKQFAGQLSDEADKQYFEENLKSAETLCNQRCFTEAYAKMSALNEWYRKKEKKYSLKRIEDTIAEKISSLQDFLPDDFKGRLELAHHYWFYELWNDAEKEYNDLLSILKTAEEKAAEAARKAEEERKAAEAARKAEEERRAFENSPSKLMLPGNVALEMVKIKAGTFMMGSPVMELGRGMGEISHQVTLTQDYWLGKFPVTQAQYEAVMGNNPSHFKGSNRPVEQVSWEDAKKFCAKLNDLYSGKLPAGYRFDLPTEAQWEYACRAGTTTSLNNGEDMKISWWSEKSSNLNEVGWYEKNSVWGTRTVGQKRPNTWGLYDMHGNVWEWCRDWYDDDYNDDATDPTGPSTGSSRVARGGSWDSSAKSCRSAFRCYFDPGDRGNLIGFRLALAPVQ